VSATSPTIRCPRTDKIVYGSRNRALMIAAQVERNTGVVYRVYQCEFCSWWHLTSKPWRRAA
jgi:hypothetical protein